MKKILLLLICLCFLSGCKDKKNIYEIELNDPYKVCGQIVYFSNNSNGKEIQIDDIIDDIKYACGINR